MEEGRGGGGFLLVYGLTNLNARKKEEGRDLGVIKGVIKDIDCYEEGGSKGEGRGEGFLLVYSLYYFDCYEEGGRKEEEKKVF